METKIGNLLDSKTGKRYERILSLCEPRPFAHQQFEEIWNAYLDMTGGKDKRANGAMFELIIAEVLAQRRVTPFYYQSSIWGIDYSVYDIAFWADGAPVILSLKTSLRERFKQAALEGMLLRMRFPDARSYIVTNNAEEAERLRRRRNLEGVDSVFVAHTPDLDRLVEELRDMEPGLATPIMPLRGAVVE